MLKAIAIREAGKDQQNCGLRVGGADRDSEGHPEEVWQHPEVSQGSHQPFLPCGANTGTEFYKVINFFCQPPVEINSDFPK